MNARDCRLLGIGCHEQVCTCLCPCPSLSLPVSRSLSVAVLFSLAACTHEACIEAACMSFITLFCRKNVKRAVEVQPDQGENVSASASSPSRKGTLRWRYRRRRQQEQQQQQQWKQRSPTPSLVFEYLVLHLFVILGSLSMASGFYSGETPGRTRKNVPTPTRGGKLSCARNEPGRHSLAPLSPPVLELITPDGCASSSSSETSSLLHCIQRAVAGGVSLVQLRDYKSDAKSKAELAVRLAAATEGRALFVVNGDPDDAHASGADGVHLPERMIDRLVGLRVAGEWPRVVGCSVHSVPAAVKAAKLGADYVQVYSQGPETQGKAAKQPSSNSAVHWYGFETQPSLPDQRPRRPSTPHRGRARSLASAHRLR